MAVEPVPTDESVENVGPATRRGLRLHLARMKYAVERWVERHVRLPLRGVRIHRTAEFQNVRFRGPAVLEAHARLMGGPQIELGRGVHVGPQVHMQGDIVLGDEVWVGPRVTFWGRDHAFEAGTPIRSQGHRTEPIRIGDHVEIGAGSILLRGVRVGAGARLGAGSICTKDVDAGAAVAGSPARAIGSRES